MRPGSRGTVRAGGMALIGGAVAFLGVFSYLAAQFNYPAVLDGAAQDVLPALLATGHAGRLAWAFYALIPLIFIPAGVGAFQALRARSPGLMRIAMIFASVAAVCMMLGLMRWPSIHWELAHSWRMASGDQQYIIAAMFNGLNVYLGNYIGEFLGELSFSLFFLLSAIAMLRGRAAPRWFAWWGVATGALGLIGMWRNVIDAVAPVAAINNYLLPAWMIGMGVWMLMASRAHPGSPERA